MLGPLVGAVGYGMTGPWREEPHPHSVPLSGGDRGAGRAGPARLAAKQTASGLVRCGAAGPALAGLP